jgi:hypothetical protein
VVTPEQTPPHALSVAFIPGIAARLTGVPATNDAAHVPLEHVIPAGVLVTVPLPLTMTLSVNVWMNVADTDRACVIETLHTPIPVQSPPQPPKTKLVLGMGVRITCVWSKYDALHVPDEHERPPRSAVTVPLPVTDTVRVCRGTNVALTTWLELNVTLHVFAMPLHAPDHPANADPLAGIAVNITVVPVANEPAHVGGQAKAPTSEVTVPDPKPCVTIVSVGFWAPPSTPAPPSTLGPPSKPTPPSTLVPPSTLDPPSNVAPPSTLGPPSTPGPPSTLGPPSMLAPPSTPGSTGAGEPPQLA